MEKMNMIKNGVLRLPPGFRFHPTDEELVLQYLKRKVFSYPLPASIIPEVDVCKSDPWDLSGDSDQKERYYFSTKEVKYPNGNRSNRATTSGYWKATGLDKQIVATHNLEAQETQVVGMKKTLVFYMGKPPNGSRTDWIMHEYRLTNLPLSRNSPQENWVLCRIFLKKRSCNNNNNNKSSRSNGGEETQEKMVFYDFMGKDKVGGGSSSSSNSSGITEISSGSDSSCNSTYSSSVVVVAPFKKKRKSLP